MNKVGISKKFGEFSWLFFMLIFSVVGLWVYMLVAFFFLGDFNSIGEFIRKIEVNDMSVIDKPLLYLIVPSVMTGKYVGTYIWAKIMRKFKLLDETKIKEMGG